MNDLISIFQNAPISIMLLGVPLGILLGVVWTCRPGGEFAQLRERNAKIKELKARLAALKDAPQ